MAGPDPRERRVLDALLAMQRRSWEQGMLGHVALDFGLDQLAEVVARDAVLQRMPAGKLAGVDDGSAANTGSLVEVVAWAAHHHADEPALAQALDGVVGWLVARAPRAADGTLFHLENLAEVWVDSVYMLVPALVVVGRTDEARRQLAGHRARLRDGATGLWATRWDEGRGVLARPEHWGTGNGWVAAGLARAVHLLGGRDDDLPGAVDEARCVLDACLAHRRDDGTFGDVVDDPSSFTELNLAQMLAYTTFVGVDDGWLPPARAEVGRSLLETARRHVDPHGRITPVVSAPQFDRPGTSAEAQAFHLLATAALRRVEGRGE